MARKSYLFEDDWDDYLDFSDSHSVEFSDLSDSEDDVHTPYVPSDSDESSSDDLEESSSVEDEEAATVHVPSSSLSADQTAVASANASSCSTASNSASTSSNSDGWVEIARDPPNFPFNENVGLTINLSSLTDFVDLFFSKKLLQMLVKQTNLYASQTIVKQGPLRRNSRMKYWK